jgi:hypothetical protein
MNIVVKLRYLPSVHEVEAALIDLLTSPSLFHRMGPAMLRDGRIKAGSGYAILDNFGPYTNATSDLSRKICLQALIYQEILALNEDLLIQQVVTSPPGHGYHNGPGKLSDFVTTQVHLGTKFLFFGHDLWSEFCTDVDCQRMVTSKNHVPWVSQTVGTMQVLPAIQGGAGFIPPLLRAKQALALNCHLRFHYDYRGVVEIRDSGHTEEFLIDYQLGLEWTSPNQVRYDF